MANQITLPAGTYTIEATVPGFAVGSHKAILYNVTTSSTLLVGTTEDSASAYATMSRSLVKGRFTLAGTHQLELRNRCQVTYASLGLGISAKFGVDEIYADAMIWKVP